MEKSLTWEIKNIIKEIGFQPGIIRRLAVASYEAEMNLVMYGGGGIMELRIDTEKVTLIVEDKGPGIPDISRALVEGYSTATEEMREMGFGAGMGLPNIKRNSDSFHIESAVDEGTRLEIIIKNEAKG